MKTRISAIILTAAATAVCLVSCTKSVNLQDSAMTLKASIADVKTTLERTSDGGKVYWTAGDKISVNGSEFTATPDPSDATRATFTLKEGDPAPSATFKAYYPASVSTGSVATLPETQVYDGVSLSNVAPMYAQSEDENLLFHNICGLLEVVLKGDKTVSSIVVSADEPLCGKFTVDENYNAVLAADAPAKGVTLDCGDGVTLTAEGVKFYIAVPAGVYHNLTFTVTDNTGAKWTRTADGNATIARNLIYTLPFTPVFKAPVVLAKWSWTALYSTYTLSGKTYTNPDEKLGAIATNWATGDHTYQSDVVEGGLFKGVSSTTDWTVGTGTQTKDRLRNNKLSKGDYFEFSVNGVTAAAKSVIKFEGVCVATTNVTTGPCEWTEEYSLDGGSTWTTIRDIKLTEANVTSAGNLDCEITLPSAISNATVQIRVRIASNNTSTKTFEDGASNMAMIVLNADGNISTGSVASRDKYYDDSWAYAVITLIEK